MVRSPAYSARLTISANSARAVLVVYCLAMYELYLLYNYSARPKTGASSHNLLKLQRVGRDGNRWRLNRSQHLIRIADAVDDGDRAQHRDDPQHRSHLVEQRADDHQHDALRALHEADLAAGDERFGAGPRVAHHDRAGHDKGGQHHVEEAVGAGVIHHQPEEQHYVAVAVDDGIEEAAE